MSTTVALAAPTQKTGGTYQSAAFEEKGQASLKRGLVCEVFAVNKNVASVFLFLFDNGTGTASGPLLMPPLPLVTNGFATWASRPGIPYDQGVYFALSSTLATYTALGTNDCQVRVNYGERFAA